MNGRTNSNGTTTDTLQIPLDAPSNVLAVAGVNSVTITYTDPLDKYGTTEGEVAQDPQQLVSVWDHSIIVRKVGSDPTGPLDGTQVCSSMIRNQYQTNGFVDMGLDINQTYHYGVFAYNESNVPSEGGFSNCHLWGFDSVLANNSWEQINQAGSIGTAPSIWEIGDEKNIIVGNETLTMVILDFNHDNNAISGGKIPMTFGTKNLMNNTIRLTKPGAYQSIWDIPLGITWKDIESKIESSITPYLKTISKDFLDIHEGAVQTVIAFPTYLEIFESYDGGDVANPHTPSGGGYQYPYFATLNNRIKKLRNGAGDASNWWTSSNYANNTKNLWAVSKNGEPTPASTEYDTKNFLGVCFQFFI